MPPSGASYLPPAPRAYDRAAGPAAGPGAHLNQEPGYYNRGWNDPPADLALPADGAARRPPRRPHVHAHVSALASPPPAALDAAPPLTALSPPPPSAAASAEPAAPAAPPLDAPALLAQLHAVIAACAASEVTAGSRRGWAVGAAV